MGFSRYNIKQAIKHFIKRLNSKHTQTMKQLFFIIFGIVITLASCQKDALILDNAAADFTGFYQFEKECMYPTVGKSLKMTNVLELTIAPNMDNMEEVLIEELGIYAKVKDNRLDIPFQTDAAGQFSYTGYGQRVGTDLQMFLNVQNHTSNTIQTCEMKGQRVETLN